MKNKQTRFWNAKLGKMLRIVHKTSISWERLKWLNAVAWGTILHLYSCGDTNTNNNMRTNFRHVFNRRWYQHQCTTVYLWYQTHPDYLCELCSNSCKRQIPITQSHSRNILFTYDEKNTIDSAAEQLQEICNNLACVTGALYIVGVLHH